MRDAIDSRLMRRLTNFSIFASALSGLVGTLGLLGWIFDIAVLKSVLPGQVAIKANTTICLLLLGTSLYLQLRSKVSDRVGWAVNLARVFALCASVIGLVSLAEAIFHWDAGIDQLLFTETWEEAGGSIRPGLMSPIAAFSFCLLGTAVLLLDWRPGGRFWPSQWLCLVAEVAAIFAILNFVLDPKTVHLYIAIQSAAVLFILPFGVICSRPRYGMAALFASSGMGGALARRLFPSALLVPMLIGWVRWQGFRSAVYSEWGGVTLMVVTTIVLLGGLVLWTALVIDQSDEQRRQAEANLRQSEERYRSLVTATAQVVWTTNPAGEVSGDMPSWREFTGMTMNQLQGWGWIEALHPEDRERTAAIWKRAVKERTLYETEYRMRRHDGEYRRVAVRGAPVKNPDGSVREWVGTCADITDRKRIEEDLRVSQERLVLAQKAAHAGTFDWDIANNVNTWTPEVEEVHGLRAGEFGGRYEDWEALVVPEDLAEAKAAIQRALHTGEFAGEWRIRRRNDGQIRWISARAKILFDGNGKPGRMIGLNTDITERKRTEEELRKASLYVRTLIEGSLDPLVTINPQGKITDVNVATEKATGIPREQLIGSDFSDYFTDREKARAGYQQVFAEGMVRDYALALRHRSGSIMDVLYNASILKNEAGEIEGVFAAARDITRMKAAEQEVRRLNAELEERVIARTAQLEAANKELEAFTYSVSHDLRSPLRHISGFAQILMEEHAPQLSPDALHHLQRIDQGAHRMGLLVDDLLNLARVGRRDIALQVTGLASVVEEVRAGLTPEIGERKVEWRIGTLPFVECDPTLMRQVFQNLLSNAVKFTRPRARAVIEVGQKVEGDAPLIYVRDNGVGFSMKYADKLFGVFQRLHRPEDFEGTGVGLATVQRIIQKHGGRVWAEAELDKGACFYFTLGQAEKPELKPQAVAAGANS